MWASLIMALISFLISKKSGKSTTQSAAIAAAAGLGTYYVATNTEWGKSTFGAFNDAIAGVTGTGYVDSSGKTVTGNITPVVDANGNPVYNAQGNPIFQQAGALVTLDANGKPVTNADGSITNALITGTAGVLKSWGATGTAAVIGTAAVASSSGGMSEFLSKNAAWIGLGLVALLVIR